jgi:hypothetical protein
MTLESQENDNAAFKAAVANLKEAGSIASWKKEFKEEFKHWSQLDEYKLLKEEAGIKEAQKKKKTTAVIQPIKVTISATNALALNEVLKDRGLRKFDISLVLDEALEQVPEEWWEQKKEELTPVEWKIQKIAQNPGLMSKLADQLDELLAEAKEESMH